MIDALRSAAEWLGLWLAVALAASLLSALCYPAFRRIVATCAAATRSASTLCYALLGPAAAVVVMFLVMQPGAAAMLVPVHCHDGTCGAHAPALDVTALGVNAVAAGGSLFLILVTAGIAFGLRAAQRRLRTLQAFSHGKRAAAYRVIDSPEALAWCCGLWRPEVYLSAGLIRCLEPDELQAVLLHERAHASRRDNLRSVGLRIATSPWPRTARERIRRDAAADAELACDAAARQRLGAARPLRSALAALHGHQGRGRTAAGAGFGDTGLATRLAALEGGSATPAAATRAWSFLGALWWLQVILATGFAHHAIEWISALRL